MAEILRRRARLALQQFADPARWLDAIMLVILIGITNLILLLASSAKGASFLSAFDTRLVVTLCACAPLVVKLQRLHEWEAGSWGTGSPKREQGGIVQD